ncbi:hypothetical protein [Pseudoteredinibacter isoporae]|uniref:Uncharacterized protein n=1 Tax=Pseudoteredinibacter isoporae TaxID=570281 RepID=A0A7X0JUB5_9GAMM|nr:hypothetical protein [Pseudoteredinibacter isoporae]MBB6521466.1 hypothetical protein [Pseudoteredinibacter isoporae]NHO87020.1 hypothetical protein [Pseudoteredinibacter isoporae]NIB24527.1 hypothetical protein [Pseudoteredinibacter isoporae]
MVKAALSVFLMLSGILSVHETMQFGGDFWDAQSEQGAVTEVYRKPLPIQEIEGRIKRAVDTFLQSIHSDKPLSPYIDSEHRPFATSVFKRLKAFEQQVIDGKSERRLSNIHAVGEGNHSVTLSYTATESQALLYSFKFLARDEPERAKVYFDLVLGLNTRHWKTRQVGDTRYHYKNIINIERAKRFDRKNRQIAYYFELPSESFSFYMVSNFQEYQRLIGVNYDRARADVYREGYGVVAGTIFSVMNNEDFSHDVVHYYSSKLYKVRNWTAEEGLAYFWGNAYYTAADGEIPEFSRLLTYLANHVDENSNLIDWFTSNSGLNFGGRLPGEVSVRSVMSALLCAEIIEKKGVIGLKELISSGKSIEDFFRVSDKLIAINQSNFNHKMLELIRKRAA